ncbi:MAG: hypothetical protein ACI9G1_001889 [Pirellulaceae bacterium]|jgi:hypothetical protein
MAAKQIPYNAPVAKNSKPFDYPENSVPKLAWKLLVIAMGCSIAITLSHGVRLLLAQ